MRTTAMKIKDFLQICKEDGALGAWVCLIISVVLIIGGAITPPPFILDSSILFAVGELFAWGVLFKLPNMIKSIRDGSKVSLKKGDFEVSVEADEKN